MTSKLKFLFSCKKQIDSKSNINVNETKTNNSDIKQLLDAELEARNILVDAYEYRNNLRKLATEEALKEIEQFRKDKLEEYKNFIESW
jgi:hypothetical protein